MAVFKPSNHSPNLSEIDLTQKNEFNCQVNTSGESIRAYKLQILSERGDEVICDGKKRTINGVTYENAGIDCSPIKNKGFLKISDILFLITLLLKMPLYILLYLSFSLFTSFR